MKLYSTKGISKNVSLKEAVLTGLPSDNGLFLPVNIPKLPASFFESLDQKSFTEIAFEVASALFDGAVEALALKQLIEDAFDFEIPLVELEPNVYVLELFYGPTFAFKDFGARFMSRLMAYFLKNTKQEINILVATSGDTGSAVGQGFFGVEGIKVTILYPKGKVSEIQEKQLTTIGGNVTALEIDGNFDDCQRLVKAAFLDTDLNEKLNLSSANSINIARLIPQSFYFFYAYGKLKNQGKPIVFSVPSGNFGNISGGLLAQKMGLPIEHFIASTNVNDIVPTYLATGNFEPKPSKETISNAMDVGDPSNFPRMSSLFDNKYEKLNNAVSGYAFTDTETKEIMKSTYDYKGYVMCPHTAVANLGLKKWLAENKGAYSGVLLSTAHPAKFLDVVEPIINQKVELPDRLKSALDGEKQAISLGSDFEGFKGFLITNIFSDRIN